MMKFFIRLFLLFVITIVLAIVFRAPIFRAVVHYEVIGERTSAATVNHEHVLPQATDLNAAVDVALDTTAAWLHFTTDRTSSDRNDLHAGSGANCIGYAALFTALLNGHLSQAGIGDRYKVEHVIGKLYIGDRDLHSAFNSAFWKDHDIVRITDLMEGTVIHIDPTLYDVTGIARVRGN